MPNYDFECKKCKAKYVAHASYDETDKYPTVKCPACKSKGKVKLPSSCSFRFANPVGTDRWNSETSGHDYRFKHNIPAVKQERENAEMMSHMGTAPYTDIDDTPMDTGVHDAEFRRGLS